MALAANVILRMIERGWSFLYRAGTLILAVSILIWAASYYPHNSDEVEATLVPMRDALAARIEKLPGGFSPSCAALEPSSWTTSSTAIAAAYQRDSYPGPMGRLDRAGRAAAGLGLADWLRGDRFVSGPRGGDGCAGRDL